MPATQAPSDLRIAPGFPDPVIGAQATFRHVLDAMANPGRIVSLEPLAAPAPLHGATASACLALMDYETPVWLDATAASDAALAFLRFHTGAPVTRVSEEASFVIVAGTLPPLSAFAMGTDQYPESAATLLIQVDRLAPAGPLTLTGPGIDGTRSVAIDGVRPDLWVERAELARAFPRGLDMIFTDGDRACALPRTTAVDVDPSAMPSTTGQGS